MWSGASLWSIACVSWRIRWLLWAMATCSIWYNNLHSTWITSAGWCTTCAFAHISTSTRLIALWWRCLTWQNWFVYSAERKNHINLLNFMQRKIKRYEMKCQYLIFTWIHRCIWVRCCSTASSSWCLSYCLTLLSGLEFVDYSCRAGSTKYRLTCISWIIFFHHSKHSRVGKSDNIILHFSAIATSLSHCRLSKFNTHWCINNNVKTKYFVFLGYFHR